MQIEMHFGGLEIFTF